MRVMTPLIASVDRRAFLQVSGVAVFGTVAIVGMPACGPSKEKAVRVASFVIEITKEALPLLDLLGSHDLAETVRAKALPALDKLKDALANADIPESRTTLETVRGILSGVETALLNLPVSPRVTTVIGVLATVRVTLLTVEAFIESEMTDDVAALRATGTGSKMRQVLEVARQ